MSLALSVFVTLTGGPGALLMFLAAASIGILFLRIGLRPASLMAFLLVPSIHFFLGFRLPGLPPVPLETVAIHAIPGTTEALTAIVVAIGVGLVT